MPRPAGASGHGAGRRRGQLLVGVTAGVAALLLVAVTAFVLVSGRDRAPTAVSASAPPDAGTPTTVVDNWLNGMFVSKDPDAMLRYTCRREADQKKVAEAVSSVKQAERDAEDADLSMTVSWSRPREVSRSGDEARVASTLEVTVGDKIQKKAADFQLIFETGWKVCDADMR